MPSNKTKVIQSEFYCTQCGFKGIPIWRKENKKREQGHLKRIFCLKCQKETNHVEIKDSYTYNDFLFEFTNHNFDINGNRIKTIGELRNGK